MTTSNMNQGQLINNIKSLQTLEQELYLNLEKLPSDSSSIDSQKEIVEQINNISQSRISLYSQVHSIYLLLNDQVSTERQELDDQVRLINISEKQLNRSKQQISKNKNLNTNNLRLTEINTYYSEQYTAYYFILKLVVYLCLPLLIIAILKQKNILSSTVTNLLGILILTIGLLFIIPKIIDVYMRNNMVFNEYDQATTTADVNGNSGIIEHDENNLDLLNNKYLKDLELLEKGECLGPECCSSGQQFVNNRCQ